MDKCPICGGRILGPKEKAQPEEFVCPCNWTGPPTQVPFPIVDDTGRLLLEGRAKSSDPPVVKIGDRSSKVLEDGWKQYVFRSIFKEPRNWTHGFPLFRKPKSYTLSYSFMVKGSEVKDPRVVLGDLAFPFEVSTIPKSKGYSFKLFSLLYRGSKSHSK